MSVYATAVLQLYLSGAWVDVFASTDVRGQVPIVCEYGIQGSTPADRIASTGRLTFALDNSTLNSGGVLGYYSPGNASKRTGFDFNIPVRWKLSYGADTQYKFRGDLVEINPVPGQYDSRLVPCQALDWMDRAAELDLPDLDAQFNKRGDELITTILDALAAGDQPVARDIETGVDAFPIALDGGATGTKPKVREVLNQICLSEFGYFYIKGDATQGGTAKFENRAHRSANPTIQITVTDQMFDRSGLVVPGSRDDIYSSVQIFVSPTQIDAAATTILYDLQTTDTFIGPGETSSSLFGPYRDPVSHEDCGGTNMQAPVSGTDYLFNSAQDGSGSNLTANLTVTPSFTGTGVRWTLTNTGATGGYVTRLRAVGKAIRRYDAVIEVAVTPGYGTRPLAFSMPFQQSTSVVTDVATYLASILKTPFNRVKSVRFLANKSATLMQAAILREPGDRIAVTETVTGVNDESTINSVRLEYQKGGVLWCTWGLEPASTQRFWVLGVAGASELGDTTYLGF